jgi:hypothetical protein
MQEVQSLLQKYRSELVRAAAAVTGPGMGFRIKPDHGWADALHDINNGAGIGVEQHLIFRRDRRSCRGGGSLIIEHVSEPREHSPRQEHLAMARTRIDV